MAVRQIVKNARKNDGIPKTAQQSIPFDRMFPDGICRVGLDYYTKTVQFQDINYQLAQQEDKTEIFEEWCAFLNFFDSSVKFQLSFENMATDVSDFEKSIKISHKNDGFDDVRDEYSEVLLHQMEAGNNGLTKTKYLTFGIHAESMKTAKPRLTHIETDILNNFKRLGVQARSLNGSERLELMHRQFHMGDDAKFRFDWKYLTGSGLSVKDFIAPSSFAFPTGRYFQIGEMYGCMSFLSIDASDISDRLLADFLSMESSQIVTMHIQSVDQNEAIKTIKHQMERYTLLLETRGNKPDIFGDNVYANPGVSEEYERYAVPGEYLTNQQFSNMHREAEKYLGYPYVWGGSSPGTSFDCSGFVSYVINNCGNGWNYGRLTANGWKNATARVAASDVKPGDLVFFQGTYNTAGASHVGIVVDPVNKIMIHCGNPIQYASYDTPYWRAHAYCYGRIQ